MFSLNQLNGWQRLGIVLAAIYLVLVITIAAMMVKFPSANTPSQRVQLKQMKVLIVKYNEMHPDLKCQTPCDLSAYGEPVHPYNDSEVAEEISRYHEAYRNEIDFSPVESPFDPTLSSRRFKYIEIVFFVWLTPVILVYFLGLGVRWVRNGFSQN